MSGETVPLKNTQGDLVPVPVEQAKDFVTNRGFKLPEQSDLDQAQLQDEHGGVGGQLGAFAEGAVSGALPGGRALLNLAGDTAEGQAGRKEANPVSSGLGVGTGLISGLIAGTGEEKLAGEAASAAAEGGNGLFDIAKTVVGAPTKGISKIGQSLDGAGAAIAPEASALAQKALSHGLGSAAEGAAYGLGQTIDDKALGDPEPIGENLLHNVGYGALFGGALGTMLAPFAKEANVGREALEADGLAKQSVSPLGDAVSEMPTKDQEGVIEGLKSERKDAPEIKQAAADIGAPVLPGMISDSPTLQRVEGALRKRGDEIGIAADQQYQKGYQIGSDTVEKTLASEAGSSADVGDQIREGLADKFEKKTGTFEAPFKAVREITDPIVVAPEDAQGFAGDMLKMAKKENLVPGTDEFNLVKNFADSTSQIESASQLAKLRTTLGRVTKGKGDLAFVGGKVADILSQAEEKLVQQKLATMAEGPAKDKLIAVMNGLPALKESYGAFKDEIDRYAKKLGLGKIAGGTDFVNKLMDETKRSSEDIAKRLFSKNDSGFLEWMQKNAPEETQLLLEREKARIQTVASKSGKFNPKTALTEIGNLSPEIKQMMFKPEELGKLDSAERYLKSFPKDFNPSGTAAEVNLTHQFSSIASYGTALMGVATGNPVMALGGLAASPIGQKAISASMKKMIEHLGPGSSGKVGALAMLEKMNGKFTNQIASKSKDLFNFDTKTAAAIGGSILAGIVGKKDDEHDNISKQLTEYSNNPEKLINDLSAQTQPLHDYAPNVAMSLQKTAARQTAFLQSKLPQMPKTGPMGPKLNPSLSQKTVFANYVNTLDNPLHVFDKIKEGSMIPADLEALSNVMPKTLQQMQQSVYSAMVNHIDKNGVENIPNGLKVQLSLFLGQDMDSSMSPQSIAANQAVLSGAAAQKDQQESQQKTARISQKGLSSITKSQSMLTNAQQISQRGVES